MTEEDMKEFSLLDYLALALRCEYLSELHSIESWKVWSILTQIPEDVFPLRDWTDAYYYLLDEEPAEATDEKMVRGRLMKKLEKGKCKKEVEK